MNKTASWYKGHLDAIQSAWEEGDTAESIGKRYGVTKSAVLGLIFRNGWARNPEEKIPTLHDRMDALNARYDQFVEETPVGRYRPPPTKKKTNTGR